MAMQELSCAKCGQRSNSGNQASYNIPRCAYMRGPPSAEGRGARARAGCGGPPPGPAPGSGDPRSLITSRFRLGHNTLRKTQTYTI